MIIFMDSMRETISKNFNRLVDESGLTKREIAKRLNTSEATMQRWKSGENIPEVNTLEELARILKVKPIEFYKSEDGVSFMSPSDAVKKYLVIPDEVVRAAQNFDSTHPVWEKILGTFDMYKELERLKAKKKDA